MQVELLLVPQCPHADAARQVLAAAVAQCGVPVSVAERTGEFPSPTILVDGVDVMTGTAGVPAAESCRLDLPTYPAVVAALSATAPAERYPAGLAVGVTSDRIKAVSAPARALHRVILSGFAATGHAPASTDLTASVNAGGELAGWLAELHDHDVIRLDTDGRIRAAYPFSGVPTPHVVTIEDGPKVFAMCAIDALGMAEMLGREITITSADPMSGAPITVTLHRGQTSWTPGTAVVFVGSDTTLAAAGDTPCCPPAGNSPCAVAAADRCCTSMNFFTGPDTAAAWMREHRQVQGQVLTQAQALALGNEIFGRLLQG